MSGDDWTGRDVTGEDAVEHTGDVFPVLVPCLRECCGGKYESLSCVGESEKVETVGGGWCAPVAKRGSQSGLLEDGTGSVLVACVVACAVFVVFEAS